MNGNLWKFSRNIIEPAGLQIILFDKKELLDDPKGLFRADSVSVNSFGNPTHVFLTVHCMYTRLCRTLAIHAL